MHNSNSAEDQQNLPNFGQGNNNPMFTQSAYTPSTQTIRMNHQMESQNNGQPMYRSTASPMHIDLGATQQQFSSQQQQNINNSNHPHYQNPAQESPFTPPRKHPLISNNNTSNTNNTTAVTKMRGYTPNTASAKVPTLPINQQMGQSGSNVAFGSAIQREISPMNREAPMISYNKALDSVAILGNEFEQTIKAFENVQDELNIWRERCQKLTEMYETQSQEEKQEYFQTQQKLEQSYREIEKLTIIVEGVNQKLEFNSQKMKTLERKCQDYNILEQKYNQIKGVSREQEAKIKVLETELTSARELIEMKDREIVDLEVYKREYADVQEKLQQLEKENNDLKHNIQDRDKTLEQQLNAIEHLSNLNNQLEKENNEMKHHFEQFEKEVEQVHDEIDHGLIVASSHMNTSNNLQSQQYMAEASQQFIGSQNEQNLHISHPHGDHQLGSGLGDLPYEEEQQEQPQTHEDQQEEEGSEYEEVEIEVEEQVVVAEEEQEEEEDEDEDDEEEDEDEDESEDDESSKQHPQELIQYQASAPTQYVVQSGYHQHPDETVHTLREQQFTQEPENSVRNAQPPQMYMTQQHPQQQQQFVQNQYYSQYGQPIQQQHFQQQGVPQQIQQQQAPFVQSVQQRQSAQFQQPGIVQSQNQQQQPVYVSQNIQNANANTLNIPPEYLDVQNPLYSSVDQSVQSSVQSQDPQQMQNQSFNQSQQIPNQFQSSPRKGSFGIQSRDQQEQIHQQILSHYSQGQTVSGNNLETLHSQHSSVAQQPSQYMTPQQFEEQQRIQFSLSQSQNVPNTSDPHQTLVQSQLQQVPQHLQSQNLQPQIQSQNLQPQQQSQVLQQQQQLQSQNLSQQQLQSQNLQQSQQQQPTTSQIIRQQQQNISQSTKTPALNNSLAQNEVNRMAQTTYNPQQQQQQFVQQQQIQPQPQQYREYERQQGLQDSQQQQEQFDNNASFQDQQQQPQPAEGQQIPHLDEASYQADGTSSQYQQSVNTYVSPSDVSQRRVSDLNNKGPSDNLRQTASVVIQNTQDFNPNTQFYSQKIPQFQISPKQAQSVRSQQQPLLQNQSIQQSQYIQEPVQYSQESQIEEEKDEASEQQQQQQHAQQQQQQLPPGIQEYNSTIQFQNQFIDDNMVQSRENLPYGHSSQELVIQGVSVLEDNQNVNINATTSILQPPAQGEQQQQQVAPTADHNVNVNKLGRGSLRVGQAEEQQQAPQYGRGSVQLNKNQPAVNVKNLMEAHQQSQVKQAQTVQPQQQPNQKVVLDEIQEENLQSQIQNAPEESQYDPNSIAASASQPHHLLEQEQQHFAQQSSLSSSSSSNKSQTQTMQQPPIQYSQQQQQFVQPQDASNFLDQTDEEPLQISTSQFRSQNLVQQAPQMIISAGPEGQGTNIIQGSQVNQANVGIGQSEVQHLSTQEAQQQINLTGSQSPSQVQQQQVPAGQQRQSIQQTQSVYTGVANQSPSKNLNKSVPISNTPYRLSVTSPNNQAQQQQQQQLESSQQQDAPQIQLVQSQNRSSISQTATSPDHTQQSVISPTHQQSQVPAQNQPISQQSITIPQHNIAQTQSVYVPAGKQGVQPQNNLAQSQPLQQGQYQSFGPAQNQIAQQQQMQQSQQPQQGQSAIQQSQINQSQQQQPLHQSQQQQPLIQSQNQQAILQSQQQQQPMQQSQQRQSIAQSQYTQQEGPAEEEGEMQISFEQQRNKSTHEVQQGVGQITYDDEEQQEQLPQGYQQPLQTQSVYVPQPKQGNTKNISQSQPLVPNQRSFPQVNNQIIEQPLEEEQGTQLASVYQPQQTGSIIQSAAPQHPVQQQQHQPQFISQSQVQQQQPGAPQGQPFYSQVQRPVQGLQVPQQQQQQIQQSQQQVPIQQSQQQVPIMQSQQQAPIKQSQQVSIQQSQQQTPVQQSQQQLQVIQQSQAPMDASQQQRILNTQSVIVYPPAAPQGAQPSLMQVSASSQNTKQGVSQVIPAVSTVTAAPVSGTSIPSNNQQQRQSLQQQQPTHLQTQSYYIPQQQQSAISFSGFSQPSQTQGRTQGQFVQSQVEGGQQPQQNTLNSINNASMAAIAPTSQVIGSNIIDPIGASQVDKKKKKKNKKKNMTQSEAPAIIAESGIEDSTKAKKSKKPKQPQAESAETSMSKSSAPITKSVITTKKVLVKKKKSIDGSQSSIKKSSVSGATPTSSHMSRTQAPPKQGQQQQQVQPQFGRVQSQKIDSSSPLSPPSAQNRMKESNEKGQVGSFTRPNMMMTAMPGLQRKSISMISSQSKDNRTVASGQNNMLNKVIAMKNQLLEKNSEIDALKLRIDENLKQIEALSSENTQLNEQNSTTREELEQVQRQLQENFEFHKSEIDNLRQEYENTIAPLLQEKQNLEESNLALSKQCEAFDIALQNSDEEKQRAIRELINEKEQLQNFSEVILKEKEQVRNENLQLKDDQSRRIKMENSLIKDNEDLKNLSSSQSKDIDTWKLKYKNLKKEINGLRMQFDSYKSQIMHEIQTQIQDRSSNFQGVLTSIKKKYYEQGDSTLSSAREMIIQQDQQEQVQAPPAFSIPRQSFNQISHSQQYHPHPQQQQQQYNPHYISQSQPQPNSHQKSHQIHSYAPIHTTEFVPPQNQNDEQFLNDLKYKINALKQTQAEQEALNIKSQKQLQSIQMHKAIQQQYLSAQKNQQSQQQQTPNTQEIENSCEQNISDHNQEDSQSVDPIEFQIEQLMVLKNQYEQALGRVNTSMSPQKRK